MKVFLAALTAIAPLAAPPPQRRGSISWRSPMSSSIHGELT
jgi:hypothetical protein